VQGTCGHGESPGARAGGTGPCGGSPRVTEIIGRFADFAGISPDVLERAATRGTLVHALAAITLREKRGGMPPLGWRAALTAFMAESGAGDAAGRPGAEGWETLCYAERVAAGDPEECPLVDGFMRSLHRWLGLVERVETVEERFWHGTYGYTGQIDAVVRYRGDPSPVLVDFKTPASPSPYWRPQVAAYVMLCEDAGLEVGRAGTLQLRRTGAAPAFRDYSATHRRDRAGFLTALEAYRYFTDLKGER
jgi:hypothetical protein